VVEQVFLDGVLVQPGDGGQPAADGGADSSGGFEVAGGQLDVGAANGEQAQLPLAAPGGELAQGPACRPRGSCLSNPARNPAKASFSVSESAGSITARAADGDGVAVNMGYLPREVRDRERSRRRMTTST
jgi:hypothetical protein